MDLETDIFNQIPDLNYTEEAPQCDFDEFMKVVRSRRSVRVYSDEPVPDSVVENCLEAALLAPNSSNLQPWEFYWVNSVDKKKLLVEACFSQNAAKTAPVLIVCVARIDTWSQHREQMLKNFDQQEQLTKIKIPEAARIYYKKLVPFVYGQGWLGLKGVLKKLFFFCKGFFRIVPRGPFSYSELISWANKSTALACQNLMLSFRASGYDTCPMEGFDEVRVKKLLNLSRGCSICMVIAAGKRASNGIYGPQIRFSKEQFIHRV